MDITWAVLAVLVTATSCAKEEINHNIDRYPNVVETEINEHPYMLILLYNEKKFGATIIGRKWALTSASAVFVIKEDNWPKIKLYAGTNEWDNITMVYEPRTIIPHPEFKFLNHKPYTELYNIALILVKTPFFFLGSPLRRVHMPKEGYCAQSGTNNLHEVGWGFSHYNLSPNKHIQEISFQPNVQGDCTMKIKDQTMKKTIMCFHNRRVGGPLNCVGDFGGPLMQGDVLVGVQIKRIGSTKREGPLCGEILEWSIYTCVAAYVRWIKKHTQPFLKIPTINDTRHTGPKQNIQRHMEYKEMRQREYKEMRQREYKEMRDVDPKQMRDMEYKQMRDMEYKQMRDVDPKQMIDIDRKQMIDMDPKQMIDMEYKQMRDMAYKQLRDMEYKQMKGMDPMQDIAIDMDPMQNIARR